MPSTYAKVAAWRLRMWNERKCFDCAAPLEDGNEATRCQKHLDARRDRERARRVRMVEARPS